jgi:hypothetical protein
VKAPHSAATSKDFFIVVGSVINSGLRESAASFVSATLAANAANSDLAAHVTAMYSLPAIARIALIQLALLVLVARIAMIFESAGRARADWRGLRTTRRSYGVENNRGRRKKFAWRRKNNKGAKHTGLWRTPGVAV